MHRVPEPELMVGLHNALAYAAADMSELNQPLLTCFQERFPEFWAGQLIDLGCGAADVSVRFAQEYPGLRVLGVDGSETMLECGRRAVHAAGLDDRIALEQRYLPDASLPAAAFEAVVSNSLLHHLADPLVQWQTALQCARPGGCIMAMDILRPPHLDAARDLVARHAWEAPPLLAQDFLNSLCAAYTAAEVRSQLEKTGLGGFVVEEVSDLHLLVWGTAP